MRNYWLVGLVCCCVSTLQAQFVRNSGLATINTASVAVNGDWDNQASSITNNGTITLSDDWTSVGGYSQAGIGGFVLTNTVTKQFNHGGQYIGFLTKNGAGTTQINDHLLVKDSLLLMDGVLAMTGVNDTLVMLTDVLATGTPTSYVEGRITRYGQGDLFFPSSRASNYLPITLSQVTGSNPRVTVSVEDKPGGYAAGQNVTVLTSFPYVWRSEVLRADTATNVEVQYPTSLASPAATVVSRGVTGSMYAGMGMQSTTIAAGVTKIQSYSWGLRGLFSVAVGPSLALDAPVATAASAVSDLGFTANWTAVAGASSYQLDISSDNFITFLGGYNSKAVVNTTEVVTGLTNLTSYSYRVRATDALGASVNSNVIDVTTLETPTTTPVATAATNVGETGFTANWLAAAGATGYELDVSTDNFSTFVAGFNSLVVSNTNAAVGGLSQNTAYKYRVRATSAAPVSANSNVIDVSTLQTPTAAPVAIAATDVGLTGFVANWLAVAGTTGYQLDVSADNFSTFVAGFNSLAVVGTSTVVSGLSTSTNYKYRVRATSSAPVSANSNVIDVTTLTPQMVAPVATAASVVTQSGFTANWATAAGATGYQLDVSLDNFVNFVPGYNNLAVTGTSAAVIGLAASTAYKFRVRATGAFPVSENSNVIDVTTLVAQMETPVATAATGVTATGFFANWNLVDGATGYLLDVSVDNFVTFLPAFNGNAVVGPSEQIAGLTAGTEYQYRVRATGTLPVSENSNVIVVTTSQKAVQTITFLAITDKTMGDLPFAVGATASSGLPVSYATASDHITIAAGQATLVSAGRETIEASQPGDGAFNAAITLIQSFCINPAKPTVTTANPNTENVTLTSSASSGNQWYKDGVAISGATNTTLSVTSAGIYTVQATVDDCVSEISSNVPLIVTGITLEHSSALLLYPNPTRDKVFVDLRDFEAGKSVQLKITDFLGRRIHKQESEGGTIVEIDVASYASGNYMVTLIQEARSAQLRFVKE